MTDNVAMLFETFCEAVVMGEADLASAMSLGYLPIFDLNADRLMGFRSELYWTHPEGGLIPFSRLSQITQSTFTFSRFFDFQVSELVAELEKWSNHAADRPKIQVDIWAAQMVSPNFSEALQANVAGLMPHFMWGIEPSSQKHEYDHIAAQTAALADAGSMALLQDFCGKNYFEMVDLPFTALSLTPDFFDPSASASRRMALLQKQVELCHQLGLKVLASGINAAEEVAAYREATVDWVIQDRQNRPLSLARAKAVLGLPVWESACWP